MAAKFEKNVVTSEQIHLGRCFFVSKHMFSGSRNLFVLSNLYLMIYICIKFKMATEITDKMATKAYAETYIFKTCNITLTRISK